MAWYDIIIRLVVALVCGGLVGFDREWRGYAAGLRTHMLVALGSAAFVLVGVLYGAEMAKQYPDAPPADALRNVAAIVGGIGFLGAGVIIQAHGKVRGLTTATGLWAVAAVGAAAGFGQWVLVAASTLLAFITLAVLKSAEQQAMPNGKDDDNDKGADHGSS